MMESERIARALVDMVLAIGNENNDFLAAVVMEMRLYNEELGRARKEPPRLAPSTEGRSR